jgi:Tat protein secretion system quality control protein TatD with DNase activity
MNAEDVADLEEKRSGLLPEIGKGFERPLVLFDAHAHLASVEFARDLPAVLARARQEGVCGILAVGESLEEGRRTLELAAGEPLIKPAVGFDPTRPDLVAAREVMAFARAHAGRWAALGEVGLDHCWKQTLPSSGQTPLPATSRRTCGWPARPWPPCGG